MTTTKDKPTLDQILTQMGVPYRKGDYVRLSNGNIRLVHDIKPFIGTGVKPEARQYKITFCQPAPEKGYYSVCYGAMSRVIPDAGNVNLNKRYSHDIEQLVVRRLPPRAFNRQRMGAILGDLNKAMQENENFIACLLNNGPDGNAHFIQGNNFCRLVSMGIEVWVSKGTNGNVIKPFPGSNGYWAYIAETLRPPYHFPLNYLDDIRRIFFGVFDVLLMEKATPYINRWLTDTQLEQYFGADWLEFKELVRLTHPDSFANVKISIADLPEEVKHLFNPAELASSAWYASVHSDDNITYGCKAYLDPNNWEVKYLKGTPPDSWKRIPDDADLFIHYISTYEDSDNIGFMKQGAESLQWCKGVGGYHEAESWTIWKDAEALKRQYGSYIVWERTKAPNPKTVITIEPLAPIVRDLPEDEE